MKEIRRYRRSDRSTKKLAVGLVMVVHVFLLPFISHAQTSEDLKAVSIGVDDDFSGFDLISEEDHRVYVMAEHWHNIKSVPNATLKLLRYLNKTSNVRILAIEQGASSAYLINEFLSSGDTLILRQIARNTMFWGKENYAFFQNLYQFNQTLPEEKRIFVRSIDIEYKMESAILVINKLIGNKEIPDELDRTVGLFKRIFEETREHREQYNGLAVMYYYNKKIVTELVERTLTDLQGYPSNYIKFFGQDHDFFSTMIQDMKDGLFFDYTNPNTNYKFRDQLIYKKFVNLLHRYPKSDVLCVIGLRHATKRSSISNLQTLNSSPIKGKVTSIRVSALQGNTLKSRDLRRINFAYPKMLKTNRSTLIRHNPKDPAVRSKTFDYTLLINENGNLTPFDNILEEAY